MIDKHGKLKGIKTMKKKYKKNLKVCIRKTVSMVDER